MNGMLHIHIQQSGRMLYKCIVLLLILSLVLSGCSEGRGDWTIELHSGYSIDCVNSREIVLVYKETPEQVGSSFAIPNYYITAYWMNDNYIVLEGIQTEKIAASEEEINNRVLSYYVVDTTSNNISDPFKVRTSLEEYCATLEIDISQDWVLIPE